MNSNSEPDETRVRRYLEMAEWERDLFGFDELNSAQVPEFVSTFLNTHKEEVTKEFTLKSGRTVRLSTYGYWHNGYRFFIDTSGSISRSKF